MKKIILGVSENNSKTIIYNNFDHLNSLDSLNKLCIIISTLLDKLETIYSQYSQLDKLLILTHSTELLAHEIRNYLTSMQLAINILNEDKSIKNNSYSKELVMMVQTDIDRIKTLISRFILSKNKTHLINKVNIVNLIRETIMMRSIINDQCKYVFKSTKKEVFVNCDIQQINQIMNNLLKNAEKSIAKVQYKQGTQYSVTVSISELQYYCLVEVKDEGIGFKANANKINRCAENVSSSMNIGLRVVQDILTRHNGTLFMYDNFDKYKKVTGASVVFKLPLSQK